MFDFAAFRAAVEARDVDRWLPFFADDAEWLIVENTILELRDGLIVRQHEVEAWD